MRWLIVALALIGIVAASLALREHYRTDASPCRINDRWDCGTVNHSPYAVFHGAPVAVIGIVGYFLLGVLALMRARWIVLLASLTGLGFSLYLTHVEADILQVWCIYCVASLVLISAITLASIVWTILGVMKKRRSEVAT